MIKVKSTVKSQIEKLTKDIVEISYNGLTNKNIKIKLNSFSSLQIKSKLLQCSWSFKVKCHFINVSPGTVSTLFKFDHTMV